jgi:TRAP-type C4-dicarboxylate transport system permease small subunit
MTRRRNLVLAVLVAVGAHQVVLATGEDAARHSAGLHPVAHSAEWSATVALLMLLVMLATGWTAWRIAALRWQLALIPSVQIPGGHVLPGTWARILVAALAIFLLQENAEHLIAHGHLPLIEPLLSGQYQAALPIFGGLALLVAITSLVVARRLNDLRAAVRLSVPPAHRPRRVGSWRTFFGDRRHRARLATAMSARRAPPASVLS